jgi:hypothetical protein
MDDLSLLGKEFVEIKKIILYTISTLSVNMSFGSKMPGKSEGAWRQLA